MTQDSYSAVLEWVFDIFDSQFAKKKKLHEDHEREIQVVKELQREEEAPDADRWTDRTQSTMYSGEQPGRTTG